MTSTLGGEDPVHDLTAAEKDREGKRLRAEARKLLGAKGKKARTRMLNRANEVSREKSKRAHHGTD